jgi:general secretion pathway protein E
VLSTLHTNSALESVSRMLDMGAEPYLVAGVCVAILAQRLVRLNCSKCRQPFVPDEDELQMLGLSAEDKANGKFFKGAGCPECRGTGFKGRLGVFEMILGTPDLRAAIVRGANQPELLQVAKNQGFRTMLDDGRAKVLAGWTTPGEVLKAVYTQSIE